MKLIIGLGNPGEKYKNNRHNVGQMVVEKLKNLTAFKTNCFMNESGKFVKKLVKQYKLEPSSLWVIHDDLDIPLGSYKIQFGKGPKEHKGLDSIDTELGTDEYWHVRVGVDNRDLENRIPGEKYVLEDFTIEEKEILEKTIKEVCKKLATS
jgi:PTH1 family peptidyl-tRNA hydrolase